MQAFVSNQPHLDISARLAHYCDEATFVDCEQANPGLPDWQTSWRHLTAEAKSRRPHPAISCKPIPDFPPVEPPPT